jgi:protein SCO1/2
MRRRRYLAALATGATATGLAGCSSLGSVGGGNPDTDLPKPELRADPEDLPYPAWGQQIPSVTVPAALQDRAVTTTEFDTPLALTFVYTNCQTACPVLTLALKRAQERALENGNGEDTNFVEISFDPARDTPAAFETYAEQRNVNLEAGNWYFLLPESEQRASEVVEDEFGLAYQTTTPEDMDQYMFVHSTLILLVNGDNYVERTYRDGQTAAQELPEDMQRLVDA